MAGGKKTTVGYWYSFAIQMGLARGPLNNIKHVKVGDLTAWTGSVSSGDVAISAPKLFGGEEKEGGVDGTLTVYMGGDAQTYSATHKGLMGGLVPDFRGVATLFWRGKIGANNPYPKPWSFRVARWSEGWDLDASDPDRAAVWYPDKARILMDGGIEAMNPAHIIYQCLTDRRWGRGLPPSLLDEESFISAANVLCAEMFGLCIRWNRQSDINEFIDSILSHIGATRYESRTTGKIVLKLIRADYDPAELPVFSYTSGLLEITEDETGAGDGYFSEVRVTYTNPIDGSEGSVSEVNLALQQATGDVASTTAAYPGVPTAALALRLARRDLDMQAATRRYNLVMDRRAWQITPGMPFKISAPDRGIDNVIVRAGKIEDTEIQDGRINVVVVEDYFGLSASSYSLPEAPGAWAPSDNTATEATIKSVGEISYRDLAVALPPGELAAVAADAGYLLVLAAQPSGTAISYDLATAATGETISIRGRGNWAPTALIEGAIEAYDALVTFEAAADLSEIEVGEAMLLGDEIVRVESVDNITKEVGIARGCADTLPRAHADGTRAWIYEGFEGGDGRDYATGEDVNVRILTITPSDALAVGDVAGDDVAIDGRQGRPYPAADMQVNGTPFASLTDAQTGEVELTWAHRDRIIQDDRLVSHDEASIGPEAGTTYTIRIYDGVTLLRTTTGITAATWTYDSTMMTADGEPTEEAWTFEHEAVRDGLVSRETYRFDVPRRRSVAISGGTSSSVVVTGYAGTNTPQSILISGGAATEVEVTGQ